MVSKVTKDRDLTSSLGKQCLFNFSRKDYHVIVVTKDGNGALVHDLDTTLPFPCTSSEYV